MTLNDTELQPAHMAAIPEKPFSRCCLPLQNNDNVCIFVLFVKFGLTATSSAAPGGRSTGRSIDHSVADLCVPSVHSDLHIIC